MCITKTTKEYKALLGSYEQKEPNQTAVNTKARYFDGFFGPVPCTADVHDMLSTNLFL